MFRLMALPILTPMNVQRWHIKQTKHQSRSKCPRRGWGELCSETILFAKKARDMATIWLAGESAVEKIATAIRKVSGFGGKGFRRNPRWLQSPFGANLTLCSERLVESFIRHNVRNKDLFRTC